jgi:hypothetical protein
MRSRQVPRKRWPTAALLLALLLPWQSFAAAAHCDLISAVHSPTAHEHCAEHEHAPNPPHHGCCADCCPSAVVAATLDWRLPRGATPELFLPAPRAPLNISLERLDRPPRQST